MARDQLTICFTVAANTWMWSVQDSSASVLLTLELLLGAALCIEGRSVTALIPTL